MRSWRTVTAPKATAVSLPDLFDYLRITQTEDIEQIEAYLRAAADMVENYTGRSLINQRILLTMDSFPSRAIELPRSPVVSIESVQYTDHDGQIQTVENFKADLDGDPARIFGDWPSASAQPGSVKITYIAGHGESSADVPEGIQQALRFLVSHFYENRLPVVTGAATAKMPLTVEYLLQQYKVYTL